MTYWRRHFQGLRDRHADVLYGLAERCVAARQPVAALQLLHEVLHENPRHEAARKALGYRRADSRRQPVAPTRASVVRVPNAELGFSRGRYWRVETPHFRILSNRSPAAGEQLGQRLEQLHAAWHQLFFDFRADPRRITRLDQLAAPPAPQQKHRVVLFATRDQYLAALRPLQPMIEKTVGIYLDGKRTSYFCADSSSPQTAYHEVTHQLFGEGGPTITPRLAVQPNFWLVEGVALYLESLRAFDGYCTVGGFDTARLQYARNLALNEQFHVPLAELATWNRQQVQEHELIRRLYSEAAGLAHFLMNGHGGSRRAALVATVRDVYLGEADEATLARRLNTGYAELDQLYLRFLNVTDDDLQFLEPVENLSLGRTGVTGRGLRVLSRCPDLQWLDLAYVPVGSEDLAPLGQLRQLRRLNLERTRASDEVAPLLAGLRQLEYLDLSGLAITDQTLAQLARLDQLESLWLTETQVTDRGLRHLRSLKRLHTLDVSGTKVTAEGIRDLKTALPKLNAD